MENNQSCFICGPDKNCEGHPSRRPKRPRPERTIIPSGSCPACVVFGKSKHASGGRHLLQSPVDVQDALKVGPVFCVVNQNNKRQVDWQRAFPVRAAGRKDGAFCIELLEGWFDRVEINEIFMYADQLRAAKAV